MRELTGEDGGVLVLVALSMVALIGAVGLVLDVGSMYRERGELSRGADAAALAIATDCGSRALPCDLVTAAHTAESYAAANADDGAAAIDTIDLDVLARTVMVRTKTMDASDGSDSLKLPFLGVLGHSGTTVKAEAVATWGYPSQAATFGLAISDCNWLANSIDPTNGTSALVTIFIHGSDPGGCTTGGHPLPGGFGWVESTHCAVLSVVGALLPSDPGVSVARGCSAAELKAFILGKTVTVAFFDTVAGQGANGTFQVSGIGLFHVISYSFGGQFQEFLPGGSLPCSGNGRCLRGYFTTAVMDDLPTGGVDRGIVIVGLVG